MTDDRNNKALYSQKSDEFSSTDTYIVIYGLLPEQIRVQDSHLHTYIAGKNLGYSIF